MFVSAGGPTVERECARYVRKHGCLPLGAVYVSTSGQLPYKGIIHAVCVEDYKWVRNSEQVKLYKAVYEALAAAERLHFSSITIPGLSCVRLRRLGTAMKRIVLAVKHFFLVREKTYLKRVLLVDQSKDVVREFHKNIGAEFGFQKVDFDGEQKNGGETGKLLNVSDSQHSRW